jgi:hypothetical protein
MAGSWALNVSNLDPRADRVCAGAHAPGSKERPVYLALAWPSGSDVVNVLRPDPRARAEMPERLAEVALLISLFAVGTQLGVPLRDTRRRLPMRLAFVSIAMMVTKVAYGVQLVCAIAQNGSPSTPMLRR